ncbi:MAG: hypothetical protein KF819_12210 [Labilithrix sp.]|nr:hypothetical protein [Labilithrix sp.]
MASSRPLLAPLAALLLAASACSSAPPPVSTTTTSSGVARLSDQGLALKVESDGAMLVRDREGRTLASIVIFETAFASELRAEFPRLERHYDARLSPGTRATAILEAWIASGVVSQGAVSLPALERFARDRAIELHSAEPGEKNAVDERFAARACNRCLEEFRSCDVGRATERRYARAGVTVAERSCEAELRACGHRASPEARRRHEEWPCGQPKP